MLNSSGVVAVLLVKGLNLLQIVVFSETRLPFAHATFLIHLLVLLL